MAPWGFSKTRPEQFRLETRIPPKRRSGKKGPQPSNTNATKHMCTTGKQKETQPRDGVSEARKHHKGPKRANATVALKNNFLETQPRDGALGLSKTKPEQFRLFDGRGDAIANIIINSI